ncbi:MAG TPA: methyltransferase domain-containing protein [Kofleriaceae bacterium]|nr:methyltransferase domain-containing protein [Kofleriaceae bacterium]
MSDQGYLLPNRQAGAARRLALLGEIYDPWTIGHLESIGIASGWRCWEAGAGGPNVATWLAARVGNAGRVLATDLDTSGLAGAHGIEIRRHDLTRDPVPDGTFDLVHARLVLVHIPERERVLAAMIAALRPGGWILIEEADPGLQLLATLQTGEAAERAQRIRSGFRALLKARGADLCWGRSLPQRLRAAGLTGVRADALVTLTHPACAELERITIGMLRDALISSGHTTVDELEAHLASVASGELDIAQPPLVSAWGRRG